MTTTPHDRDPRRRTPLRSLAALATLAIALAVSGCASSRAVKVAEHEEEHEHWDLAVLAWEKAASTEPGDTNIRIGLKRARIKAAQVHYERGRVYPGWKKKLVLVGGSRLLCDGDLDVFADRLPGYEIVQLSVLGKTPIATLRDLADDERVRDVSILVDVAEHALERKNWPDQNPWIEHYRRRRGLTGDLEIHISSLLRSHLVMADPSVGFGNLVTGKWPRRDYVTYGADRSCRSDYTLTDAAKARAARTNRVKTWFADNKIPDPADWLAQAKEVDPMVARLTARGVRVAFLRPPTTGDHWTMDTAHYTRDGYWNPWAAQLGVPTIYFKDVPGLDQFDAPDGSHLDQKDIGLFTECLVDELVKAGIVDVASGAPASRCVVRRP